MTLDAPKINAAVSVEKAVRNLVTSRFTKESFSFLPMCLIRYKLQGMRKGGEGREALYLHKVLFN